MPTDSTALIANPFAALSAVVGPAVLANASSVMALGTSNRLARVVDRTRVLVSEITSLDPFDPGYAARVDQREALRIRASLLLKALGGFYAAIGLFAGAALLSALGSVLVTYDQHPAFQAVAVVALTTGAMAVAGLVSGCVRMVRETRLAVWNLAQEAGQTTQDAAEPSARSASARVAILHPERSEGPAPR